MVLLDVGAAIVEVRSVFEVLVVAIFRSGVVTCVGDFQLGGDFWMVFCEVW